jgi:hypothetical protein
MIGLRRRARHHLPMPSRPCFRLGRPDISIRNTANDENEFRALDSRGREALGSSLGRPFGASEARAVARAGLPVRPRSNSIEISWFAWIRFFSISTFGERLGAFPSCGNAVGHLASGELTACRGDVPFRGSPFGEAASMLAPRNSRPPSTIRDLGLSPETASPTSFVSEWRGRRVGTILPLEESSGTLRFCLRDHPASTTSHDLHPRWVHGVPWRASPVIPIAFRLRASGFDPKTVADRCRPSVSDPFRCPRLRGSRPARTSSTLCRVSRGCRKGVSGRPVANEPFARAGPGQDRGHRFPARPRPTSSVRRGEVPLRPRGPLRPPPPREGR